MRKMMLLAATVAIATLMMAAAPAFAQDNGGPFRPIDGAEIKRGDCGGFEGRELSRERVIEIFGEEALEEAFPGRGIGVPFFCVDFDNGRDGGNNNGGNNNGGNNNGGNNNGGNNNGGNNNGGNNDDGMMQGFEITQDFEQEAESGDIDQSFNVSQTGDNSNQTVGINGTANTGNLQTQTGFIDAGDGFGNFDGNNDDDERFFFVVDDFCDFGDFDGDGICDRLDRLEERFEDRCENGDNDGDGICDRLEERIEDLEDRIDDGGFFFVVDDDFDGDDDRFFGGNDGGDFEFEDIGSELTVSGDNMVTSDQQVNQVATAFGK